MAKIPHQPEEIFEDITGDYKSIFGSDLLSVILYGSGARGDYTPGKSDINFLIMLTQKGMDNLHLAIKTVARWRKRNVAIPLFMTRDYVLSSLDAYPVEFLNMKRDHVTVFGEDMLAELDFQPAQLRLQLEREVKAKLLHLRKGYLEAGDEEKPLRRLIKASMTAFIALFTALLYLKGIEVPGTGPDTIRTAARAIGFDEAIFLQCAEIRDGRDRFSSDRIRSIAGDYLKEVNRLGDLVDRMTVT